MGDPAVQVVWALQKLKFRNSKEWSQKGSNPRGMGVHPTSYRRAMPRGARINLSFFFCEIVILLLINFFPNVLCDLRVQIGAAINSQLNV